MGIADRKGLRRCTSLLTVLLGALSASSCSFPTFGSDKPTPPTFYISPSGNDAAAGTSQATAWKTLRKASSVPLAPGSRLLLQGGKSFVGTLSLGKQDTGTSSAPVVVGSYGSGAATIDVPSGNGISVYDIGGVDIENLNLVGVTKQGIGDGIHVYSDLPSGHRLDHIDISRVHVSKFLNGISVGGRNAGAGFAGVQVTNSTLNGNIDAGLITFGPSYNTKAPTYANQDVVISRVVASGNLGNPQDKSNVTGNGIVLGSVLNGTISSSVAAGNGGAGADAQGPEGIWTYDSTAIDIEHNLSYGNKTRNTSDGDGFGLDENTTHSVIQDNLSYGNDGSGFLVYSPLNNGAERYNTVRDNISSDDVRDGSQFYGGVSVVGFVANCRVYQNTVVIGPSALGSPPALRVSPDLKDDTFVDNLFTTQSAPIVATTEALPRSSVVFEGNDYYAADGGWQVAWGNTSYGSLQGWQAATGQETAKSEPTGFAVNPQLAGPVFGLSATKPGDPSAVQGFQLRPGSQLIGAGRPLADLYPVPSSANYLGQPQSAQHPDIGAL